MKMCDKCGEPSHECFGSDKPIVPKDDLTCPRCDEWFTTPQGYVQHMTAHATSDIEKEWVKWLKYKASLPAPPEFIGIKHDATKPRWSLLPAGTIYEVVKVLEYGAVKYKPDNWQKVPDARTRYYDAAMRHVEKWWQGEELDPESGLPHLAHAVCCLLFLMWLP